MKILVISRPRCRTSFLCESASLFYNIPNLHEDYDYIMERYKIDYQRYFLLKKTPSLKELNQNLLSHVNFINNKIQQQNGVIKFFPRHLLSYFFTNVGSHMSFDDIKTFSYICETNITESFNLKMYDKIILLERDLLESAISYANGIQTKKMLFFNAKEFKYELKKVPKISIDNQVFKNINFYIFEYFMYLQLKNYINNNFENVETLTYDTCTEYVKKHYNNQDQVKYIDTKFNYADKIINYNELKSYILNTVEQYSILVPNFDFK